MTPLSPQLVHKPSVPRRYVSQWHDLHGIVAGLTGGAQGPDFHLAEGTQTLSDAWLKLSADLNAKSMVVGRQPHGARVAVHDDAETGGLTVIDGFDAHITRVPEIVLAVTVADCVPVYLYHPVGPCVGIVHAGWRGIAAGIIESATSALAGLAGSAVADIVIHCGVSICGDCYEVGPEVWGAMGLARPPGPKALDLRDLIVNRALQLGIKTVTVSGDCTAHGADRFCSYRRSAAKAGRMAAFIVIPMA